MQRYVSSQGVLSGVNGSMLDLHRTNNRVLVDDKSLTAGLPFMMVIGAL